VADDWYTPKFIFDALDVQFDLDVCSPVGGTGIVPAEKFYTIEDDCLAQNWDGFVWMNPPYSNPTPFVEKFITHKNGICLVPMAKAKWFHKLWAESDVIVPMPVNLKFHRPNDSDAQIMFNTALVGIGSKAIASILRADLGRVR
jgi:phage N-6-adenine-methyltransferase